MFASLGNLAIPAHFGKHRILRKRCYVCILRKPCRFTSSVRFHVATSASLGNLARAKVAIFASTENAGMSASLGNLARPLRL